MMKLLLCIMEAQGKQFIDMKYLLEIRDQKFEIDFGVEKEVFDNWVIATEFPTKAKAQKAYNAKTLKPNQFKRLHQCYNDEPNPKPCVILDD